MLKKFYSTRDAVSGIFNQPFEQYNEAVAKRSFKEATENVEGIKEHAQDMELYFIGEFDNETGIFVPAGVPELILKGVKKE